MNVFNDGTQRFGTRAVPVVAAARLPETVPQAWPKKQGKKWSAYLLAPDFLAIVVRGVITVPPAFAPARIRLSIALRRLSRASLSVLPSPTTSSGPGPDARKPLSFTG